jgi:hypothetical protein
MALREIPLNLDLGEIPKKVGAWIAEGERRSDEFYEAGLGRRYPRYIPSDPKVVHAAIACLQEEGHLEGDVFCEWGCGFGIASGIAALRGMKAYGIEIEEELVRRATRLAEDCGIPVRILHTDYLPDGFEESEGVGGKDLILPEARTTRAIEAPPPDYEGLDPDEVDLLFVYPWPGQERMMMDLFTAVASHGAVLLIYLGDGEIAAYGRDESGEELEGRTDDWLPE